MYKKQICKVSFAGNWGNNKYNGYGVCIGDNCLLLENGNVLHVNKEKNLVYQKLISYYHDFNEFYLDARRELVKDCSVSATRNVPEDIRSAMESAATSAIKIIILNKKLQTFKTNIKEQIGLEKEAIDNMPALIRDSKGLLSEREFVKAFKDNLSENVKYAMKNSTQRGYNGMDGEYEVNFWGKNLSIERDVWIDKYCTPSFTYLEYDDTRQMYDDAENDPEYKAYIKEYSKPLPVNSKIEEYLSLGDKNSLTYHGIYHIDIGDKPLTKDYAIKLADKFCGVEKEKEIDR